MAFAWKNLLLCGPRKDSSPQASRGASAAVPTLSASTDGLSAPSSIATSTKATSSPPSSSPLIADPSPAFALQRPPPLAAPLILAPTPRKPSLALEHAPLHSFSLEPPTPVDGPARAPFSTPPRSSSPIQRSASPDVMIPMAPEEHPASPFPSSSASSLAPRSPGMHHRHQRTSSSGSRSFKETLNAFTADGHDGTRSVNQYILKERLGQGSYATVERATDRVTHVDYAVKEFSKAALKRQAAQAASKGSRARGPRGRPPPQAEVEDPDEAGPHNLSLVRSEVAIMKKVNHPNVASVHEVIDVTSSDALLVVMELCAGGPITQVSLEAQSAPMEEWRARDIAGQMLMGIAYLHHNHIIHRDIKPDNCLFMEDHHTVKLVDFGVSQMFTKETDQLEKSTGSPAFMAPELLALPKPEHTDGYACDIWSFGVTLYAMVAGRLPFVRDNIFDLMQAIKEDEVDYPASFSPALTTLLRSMLDRNPSTRTTPQKMWTDPWLTSHGTNPLPCSYEENCKDPIVPPSDEELDAALLSFHQKVLVARAANKFRKFTGLRRGTSSDSVDASPGGSPGPISGSPGPTSSSPLVSEAALAPSPDPSLPPSWGLKEPVRQNTGSSATTDDTGGPSTPGSTPSPSITSYQKD